MTTASPIDQLCDCRCPLHDGAHRSVYDANGCACLVTCSTQPLTLLVKEWGCALFVHPGTGRLWFVNSVGREQWDWESSNEIDDRSDVFEVGRTIGRMLREIQALLAGTDQR